MVDVVYAGKSGAGSESFGAVVTVFELVAVVTTLGDFTSTQGHGEFKRVFQAGWYGVGYNPTDNPPGWVSFGKFIQYDREDLRPPGAAIASADTFFWDLDPGVVVDFEVQYTP